MSLIDNNDFTLHEDELARLNDWAIVLREKMGKEERMNAAILVAFKFSPRGTAVTAACGWVTSEVIRIRN